MNPREIVEALTGHGFTQTDIARALGMMSKGSGSYVGQVARGAKSGEQHLAPLRAMLAAVGGRTAPPGRGMADERQRMLTAPEVQPVRRKDAKGRAAAVRRPSGKFHQTKAGHQSMRAAAGRMAMESGGRPLANAVDLLADSNGRFSLVIVGRFAPGSEAMRTMGNGVSNFRPRYRKGRRNATLRKGSRNVLEGSFANGGKGFEAAKWQEMIAEQGSFSAALRMWAEAQQGIELPDRIDRVELYGTPRPEEWNERS